MAASAMAEDPKGPPPVTTAPGQGSKNDAQLAPSRRPPSIAGAQAFERLEDRAAGLHWFAPQYFDVNKQFPAGPSVFNPTSRIAVVTTDCFIAASEAVSRTVQSVAPGTWAGLPVVKSYIGCSIEADVPVVVYFKDETIPPLAPRAFRLGARPAYYPDLPRRVVDLSGSHP
jgi:hypothetical protein